MGEATRLCVLMFRLYYLLLKEFAISKANEISFSMSTLRNVCFEDRDWCVQKKENKDYIRETRLTFFVLEEIGTQLRGVL